MHSPTHTTTKKISILVTGSEGYVGSSLVPLLLMNGYEVAGIDVGWFLDAPVDKDFRHLTVQMLKQYDAVIHLAGLSDDKLCNAFPAQAGEFNVTQTTAFAKRCKQAGIATFVLASSAAIYGNSEALANEDAAPHPTTIYAKGKLMVEGLLLAEREESFNVICLRFGSGFGLSNKPRNDLVLNRLAIRALTEGKIGLQTDGRCYRPFVHVADMAAALLHAVSPDSRQTLTGVYNIVHPEGNTTVADAVRLLADITDAELLAPVPVPDPRCYQIDPNRFIQSGFDYRWSLSEGLRWMVRELRYKQSFDPELDRVTKLADYFAQSQSAASQSTAVNSISPSVLSRTAHRQYLDDVDDIVRHSRYRLTGHKSCEVANLTADEYQLDSHQRVLTMRSGTDALMRALMAVGVKRGSYVAIPDQCFHAVAAAVLNIGALPLFVDIRPDDLNISVDSLSKKIQSRQVAAIVAVDNYGTPADWRAVAEIANAHNTPFIVDACESLGASRLEQQVARQADVIVISFSFTKPVHAAGMGGALIADKAVTKEIEHNELYLYRQLRMPEINAAYLVQAWDKLHDNIAHLREVYGHYAEAGTEYGFRAQIEYGISTRIHAPLLIPTRWPDSARDELVQLMKTDGFALGTQFNAQSQLLSLPSACLVSKSTAARVVTLPTGGNIPLSDVKLTIDALKRNTEKLNGTLDKAK